MNYWDYYKEDFDWPTSTYSVVNPELTLPVLLKAGMSECDALRHVNSGYVYCEISKTIIDRYYGGALMSRNPICRWSPEELVKRSWIPPNPVKVYDAGSWREVHDIVDAQRLSFRSSRKLFFRGQTKNYTLDREVPNPSYVVQGIGEISLIPSLWRKMLLENSASFHEYRSPYPIFWRILLDKYFDTNEIEERRLELCRNGDHIYSYQDMEDCADELLNHYGKLQLDLLYEQDYNLASILATLLQHYGLLSPVLDLTKDLDVARFFATHKFNTQTGKYEFIGTNSGESVIYVLYEDFREMEEHQQADAVIEKFEALRPQRQSCVITKTSSLSLNLPAEFLLALIRLKFEDDQPPISNPKELFPGPDKDHFLRALQSDPISAKFVTSFD